VCFVCLGNICRSPTAEGVFRHLVKEAGCSDRFTIESAGTAAYHAGEPPDRRSAATARRRGFELSGRAQPFRSGDFARFDYVIAMDRQNRADLRDSAPTPQDAARVVLLRSFDAQSPADADVPDPYYGGPDGFDHVVDICEAGCRGLLQHLRAHHELG
jgi:protein-tyrosine phosphatase